jgi:hypothetical protein
MATTKGPPANPSLMGAFIPTGIGMEPMIIPSAMITKMGIRFTYDAAKEA